MFHICYGFITFNLRNIKILYHLMSRNSFSPSRQICRILLLGIYLFLFYLVFLALSHFVMVTYYALCLCTTAIFLSLAVVALLTALPCSRFSLCKLGGMLLPLTVLQHLLFHAAHCWTFPLGKLVFWQLFFCPRYVLNLHWILQKLVFSIAKSRNSW